MQQNLAQKLTKPQSITSQRMLVIKKSYLLLVICILGMIIGGKVGSNSPLVLNLFNGFMGWILAMVALNAIPMIALRVQHNPNLAVLALFGNGFVAGIVLAPMLYIAQKYFGGDIVLKAAIITGIVFASVTFSVYTSKTTWSPSRSLIMGLFFAVLGGIVLSFFIQTTIISLLITLAIGAIGVIGLISSTSDILNNEQSSSSPVLNAIMLFSGVFMIFQAILSLLMIFGGSNND